MADELAASLPKPLKVELAHALGVELAEDHLGDDGMIAEHDERDDGDQITATDNTQESEANTGADETEECGKAAEGLPPSTLPGGLSS